MARVLGWNVERKIAVTDSHDINRIFSIAEKTASLYELDSALSVINCIIYAAGEQNGIADNAFRVLNNEFVRKVDEGVRRRNVNDDGVVPTSRDPFRRSYLPVGPFWSKDFRRGDDA